MTFRITVAFAVILLLRAAPSRAQTETATTYLDAAAAYSRAGKSFADAHETDKATEAYDKAVAAYKAAIAEDPTLKRAYIGLVGIYLNEQSRPELALPVLKAVRQRWPDDAGASELLGLVQRELKQYDDAIATLRDVLRMHASREIMTYANHNLGAAYTAKGQYEQALGPLKEALRLTPGYAPAWYDLGLAYFQMEQIAEAASAFRQAVRYDPQMVNYQRYLLTSYARLARMDEALRVYVSLQKLDRRAGNAALGYIDSFAPGPVHSSPAPGVALADVQAAALNALLKLADAQVEADNALAAASFYKRALLFDPRSGQAYAGLAACSMMQQQWQQAVDYSKHAFELRPPTAGQLLVLGDCYAQLKQYDDAITTYRRALSAAPGPSQAVTANYDLGITYNSMKRYGEGVAPLREALRLDPQYYRARLALGASLFFTKRYADAAASLEAGLRNAPEDVNALTLLGITYMALGRKEDAQKVYETLKPLDKEAANVVLRTINAR